jgi:hypothetical protein
MIDFTNLHIDQVSVHQVGNKTKEEDLILAKSPIDTSDILTNGLMAKFFTASFTNPEFYSFTFSNEDFNLNPLFSYATQVFKGSSFHLNSINIAKHLYELSLHPQIKSGDLFVAWLSGINVKGVETEALGIFKSENKQSFLKVNQGRGEFTVNYEDGINTEKLDKGCLIFNLDEDSGLKVCIVDKSNKATEAQFWKDDFLQIKPCNDEYHQTKEFMNLTKSFVTKQLEEDFVVTKADKIDLLNRSVDYFKTHDNFDKLDFEKDVFQDEAIIKSFQNFNEAYKETSDFNVSDFFEISPQAVKKQERVFKNVLKLDKNFHIYIHGDRKYIEQGVENDGRKFYKIYFENEA